MSFQAIAKKIFGDNIPKDAFIYNCHPYTKIILMIYFCLMAWYIESFDESCFLLIVYFALIFFSKKNPFAPLIIWPWVVLVGYMYYTIALNSIDSKEISKVIFYPIKAYLLIAPVIHISKTINTIELVQVLPNKIRLIAIPIMAFSRYIAVAKDQFMSTKEAFHLRGVSMKESILNCSPLL